MYHVYLCGSFQQQLHNCCQDCHKEMLEWHKIKPLLHGGKFEDWTLFGTLCVYYVRGDRSVHSTSLSCKISK